MLIFFVISYLDNYNFVVLCSCWITSYDKNALNTILLFKCFFKTASSGPVHRLFVSFWFFLLREGRLLLPVRVCLNAVRT